MILLKFAAFILAFLFVVFFAGTETALTSLSRVKVKKLIIQRGKKDFSLWMESPNRVLTAILIGNAVALIFATILATSIALDLAAVYSWKEKVAVACSTGIVTAVVLIFGEILPKTYGRENAEMVSQVLITPMAWFDRLLTPFASIMVYPANLLIHLLKTRRKETPLFTKEEISTLLEVGKKEGAVDDEERRMLQSILKFGETIVRDVMVPRVDMVCVDIDQNQQEIFRKITNVKYSRIPVYKGNLDNIVGIIYTKEILTAWRNRELIILEDLMRQPYFVPETKKVNELLEEFKKGRMHMAIVVDEYGITSGLVTIEDLIEEITGEILDEYDTEEQRIVQISDREAVVYAKEDLDKVNEVLGLELPAEEFASVGGLVMDLFGRVPRVGEEISLGDLRFLVLEADKKKVTKVKIIKSGETRHEKQN